MLLHPIYQLLLEGGYDPLVLSSTTERMLLHPIYQLLLEEGYNPLGGMSPAIAPPLHPNMFLSTSISSHVFNSNWFLGLCLLLLLLHRYGLHRHFFPLIPLCMNTFIFPADASFYHCALSLFDRTSS